jgi:hypothetical protein
MRQTQCHKPSRFLTWYAIFFWDVYSEPLSHGWLLDRYFHDLNEGYKAMDILKGQYEP